jgi:Acetyl/propionyl-CoA carboxylase, alpha subunit
MEKEDIKILSGDVHDAIISPDDVNVYTEHIQIHTEGRKYKTLFTKKFAERKKWEAPNPNLIKSIIPGSVDSILVKEKSKVKKGDKLMIYEAMKMKNVITAPFDATIVKIDVAIGNKVPKGTTLIELKPL